MNKQDLLYKRQFLLSLSIIILFVGCNQQGLHHRPSLSSLSCQELEARHYDIPILLNAQSDLARSEQQGSNTILTFIVDADLSSTINFYRQEMERQGWRELFCVEGFETLLNFEKPQKFASISIRPAQNQFEIVIYIVPKDSFTDYSA